MCLSLAVSPEGSVAATPSFINANRAQQAVFTCSGVGGPDNMFQWVLTRDGSITSNTPELSLTSTAMIGGDYECTVSNQAGNESATVSLNGIYCSQIVINVLIYSLYVCSEAGGSTEPSLH